MVSDLFAGDDGHALCLEKQCVNHAQNEAWSNTGWEPFTGGMGSVLFGGLCLQVQEVGFFRVRIQGRGRLCHKDTAGVGSHIVRVLTEQGISWEAVLFG